MNVESLDLGPTPCAESCEQLGPNYDPMRARAECKAFIAQIVRAYGEPPAGGRLHISSNAHDFGTYHEVEVRYDGDDAAAVDWAFMLEADPKGLLQEWDAEARAALGIAGDGSCDGTDDWNELARREVLQTARKMIEQADMETPGYTRPLIR